MPKIVDALKKFYKKKTIFFLEEKEWTECSSLVWSEGTSNTFLQTHYLEIHQSPIFPDVICCHHSNWSAISLSRSDERKTFIDSVKIMPLGLRRIVKTFWDKVEITLLHIVYQGVSSVKHRRFLWATITLLVSKQMEKIATNRWQTMVAKPARKRKDESQKVKHYAVVSYFIPFIFLFKKGIFNL